MSILKGQIKRHDNGTALTDTILHPETSEDVVQKFDSFDNSAYLLKATPTDKVKGSYERLNKIVGGTICWNQIISIPSSRSKTENGVTFTDNRDGTYTVSTVSTGATANTSMNVLSIADVPRAGHIAMIMGCPPGGSNERYYLWDAWAGAYDFGLGEVYHINQTGSWDVRITVKSGAVITTPITFTPCLIDLTQMFGSTVANYIYSLEQSNSGDGVAFVRPFIENADKSYNAGELVSVKTSAHETVGFNQWDEEWEGGKSLNENGNIITAGTGIVSKNFIPVLSGMTYYIASPLAGYMAFYDSQQTFMSGVGLVYYDANSTFTIPANACYMRFRTSYDYGVIYHNDICINLSHSGYRNGEYEPYVKHTYALDSELELRGIPKLDANNKLYYDGDEYASDGTVTRKYGIVDLGTLSWGKATLEGHVYFNGELPGVKTVGTSTTIGNIICDKYITDAVSNIYSNVNDKTIGVHYEAHNIWVYDSAYNDYTVAEFKTAMSGVYLVYELATPTTELADPYEATEKVDAYGTESFIDYRSVPVPVYTETNYLSDLSSSLYEEFDIQNHLTHNLPIVSKTYPAYTITANDTNNGYLYFGTVDINDKSNFYKSWGVHYRVTVNTTTTQCNGTYDVFYGVNGTTINYSIFNNFYSSSYYPIYYHLLLYPKSATYINKQAHFGVRIQSAYFPTTLAREIKVEVLESFGCTVTLKDNIVLYKDLYNSTYFTSGAYNANSLGLQETGDADSGFYLRYYSTKAQTAITAGKLIVGSDSGYSHLSPSVAFDLKYPILYAPSAISAGDTGQNYKFHYAINLTTTQSITLTAYKAVYLVGTLNGTMFTPDTTMFTQTIPTTVNNKVYKYIGHAYNTTNISFDATDDRLYAYYGDAFQEITNVAQTIKTNNGISQSGLLPIIRTDGSVYTHAASMGNFDANGVLTLSGVKVPWSDITNKPTIPEPANNASLSLQANGTTKTTFYANDATNKTFNIANGTSTTGNGTISVGDAAVSVYGLKSAAYTESSAYVPTSRTINGIPLSSNVSLYKLVTHGDNRSINTTPNDYANVLSFEGLKNNSTIGITSEGVSTYSYLVGLRGWSDSSGGKAWELAFNNKGINVRNGATTTWGAWDKLLTESDANNKYVQPNNTSISPANLVQFSADAYTIMDSGIPAENVAERLIWTAHTHGQVWSRICYVQASSTTAPYPTEGYSFLLNVKCTRSSVVSNATFLINCSHAAGQSRIVQLNSNAYSTSSFKIRILNDNSSNLYVELYDTAQSIASGTDQTWHCSLIPISKCTVTKYTSFSSGATVSTGFTVGQTLTTTQDSAIVANKFVGALTGTVDGYTIAKSVPADAKFTDTWKVNTASQEGYVSASEGATNQYWGTDSTGNPAWHPISNVPVTSHTHGTINYDGTISRTITDAQLDGGTILIVDHADGKLAKTPLKFDVAGNARSVLSAQGKWLDLATVATSGSYNDLTNKPTVNQVNQSASTTASWRNLLLGYSTLSTPTGAVATVTNVVYGAVGIAAQPSTGTMRATKYNVADKVQLEYDTTNECLNFVFV